MTNLDIKMLSAQLRPEWAAILQQASGVPDAVFLAKLCHTPAGSPAGAPLMASCFPADFKQDTYYELLDMNSNPLYPGFRVLAALRYVADRAIRYLHRPNAYGGSYLVPVSDFEIVSQQDLRQGSHHVAPVPVAAPAPFYAPQPNITPVPVTSYAPQPQSYMHVAPAGPPQQRMLPAPEPEVLDEKPHYLDDGQEDAPYDELSARDKYAIRHSVPVSNKRWINDMVKEGNNYLAEEHQQRQAA